MKLELPITNTLTIEEFLKTVQQDIEQLDKSYDSCLALLGDTVKGAMSWAPACFMSKQVPKPQQMYELAVRLLAICYATERAKSGGNS